MRLPLSKTTPFDKLSPVYIYLLALVYSSQGHQPADRFLIYLLYYMLTTDNAMMSSTSLPWWFFSLPRLRCHIIPFLALAACSPQRRLSHIFGALPLISRVRPRDGAQSNQTHRVDSVACDAATTLLAASNCVVCLYLAYRSDYR